MSRYVDMIGWDDVPHLQPPHISKEELDELEADMQPHQREARRKGKPSLGAGAIYPVEDDHLLIDPFPIPDYWHRGYGFDVVWKRTAALFGAWDPDTNGYFLTGEYYETAKEPVMHAHGIQQMMPWKLTGACDPAANGANQKDGSRLRLEYEELGLDLITANNALGANLHRVLVMMQSGQLKVFRTLTNWRREKALYRRDEKGRIVKENDHLMDCMRYLLNTDGVFSSEPLARGRRARGRGEW